MRDTYRPRRILAVFAALALPAVTCGVAPALQDLLRRTERLERFVANAHLPPVLMDEHNIVVGTVLEYNDVMLFSSASWPDDGTRARAVDSPRALATVLYTTPEGIQVVLEANSYYLYTPAREGRRDIYFESSDCTGVPYRERSDSVSPWREAWLRPSGRILYLGPGGMSRGPTRTFYSRLVDTKGLSVDTTCEASQEGFIRTEFAGAYEPVADLSVYTPPFRIVDQRELTW